MLARTPGLASLWEEASKKHDWWPDWRGQACAIVASGPSAKKANLAALKGRMPVLAIKECVELAPWADVVYGCDAPWWKNQLGLPRFKGLKVSAASALTAMYSDIRIVEVDCRCHKKGGHFCRLASSVRACDVILTDVAGRIGSGGNSGFQALNLVAQFGATKVLLIGFDVTDKHGVHWYGRANGPGRSNPIEDNFRRWRTAFAGVSEQLAGAGIKVANASPTSTLTCFQRMTVEQAVEAWT